MASKSRKELTLNERRFVREYVVDRNATRAYLRAYGNGNDNDIAYTTAKTESCKLLTKPYIKAELAIAERAHARRCGISARRVLREIASVAFADVSEAFDDDPANGGLPSPRPLSKIDAPTRRAIQSVKVKRRRLKGDDDEVYEVEEVEYKLADKLSALEKLCKHLGLTSDGNAIEKLLAMIEDEKANAKPAT